MLQHVGIGRARGIAPRQQRYAGGTFVRCVTVHDVAADNALAVIFSATGKTYAFKTWFILLPAAIFTFGALQLSTARNLYALHIKDGSNMDFLSAHLIDMMGTLVSAAFKRLTTGAASMRR